MCSTNLTPPCTTHTHTHTHTLTHTYIYTHSAEPPDVWYKLHPGMDRIIEEGKLSSAQLESITYATQQHERTVVNGGEVGGFFIGDGGRCRGREGRRGGREGRREGDAHACLRTATHTNRLTLPLFFPPYLPPLLLHSWRGQGTHHCGPDLGELAPRPQEALLVLGVQRPLRGRTEGFGGCGCGAHPACEP